MASTADCECSVSKAYSHAASDLTNWNLEELARPAENGTPSEFVHVIDLFSVRLNALQRGSAAGDRFRAVGCFARRTRISQQAKANGKVASSLSNKLGFTVEINRATQFTLIRADGRVTEQRFIACEVLAGHPIAGTGSELADVTQA